MKTWTFEVEIEEGGDEFWESNPSYEEVQQLLIDQLYGITNGAGLDGAVKIIGHKDEIQLPESTRISRENGSFGGVGANDSAT